MTERLGKGGELSDGGLRENLDQTCIVIALKDDERIFRCLDSIDTTGVEVVLALNGTPASLRQKLESHRPRPVLTTIPDVGNLGAAYNAGIAATSRRYILLMDSDCVFRNGTIERMVRAVVKYPVVKGQVVYQTGKALIGGLIARIREFDEGDYISALSPPLIYDRALASRIGGYHFNDLIHWCEDREFDFRLQMADIPVWRDPEAVIFHDAQQGFDDLRSYWRYGIGEGIGQEMGVFTTPLIPLVWRLGSDIAIVLECTKRKGLVAGLYYMATLGAFHLGTLWHLVADPYRVRRRYPQEAGKVRVLQSIPQHCVRLTARQKEILRKRHAASGHTIVPTDDYRRLLRSSGLSQLETSVTDVVCDSKVAQP
jgi:glycosyltransferase involved in cell wall biosynthesis